MAKKSRHHKTTRREEAMDKPSYAMDVFEEKPKKPVKEKPREEAFHVGDTIGGQAADKLAQLKEQLAQTEQAKAPAKQSAKPRKTTRTAQDRLAENPDLSFAELFDPQEDERTSFEELLESSKLDWHYFKDE